MPGEARRRRLRALLRRAALPAAALERIEAAFVHESAAREEGRVSNERLEFLGDSVVGLVVADWLYRTYPGEPEGVLAKRKAATVTDRLLAETARRLGFGDMIELGSGERTSGGADRTSVLAAAFEAFVATVYQAGGMETARDFVEREHLVHLDVERAPMADAKTRLQELTQASYSCTPDYVDRGEGPAHSRTFTTLVSVAGEHLAEGTGPTKKAAQQDAAEKALRILETRQHHSHL